ncbi:hypothetical protein UlMin_037908 [Ulmus minor]
MEKLYYLPEETMEEILLRLPPQSLVRFKCVCKSWNRLINDPSFINKHLLINKNSSCTSLFLTCDKLLSLASIFNDKNNDNSDYISYLVEEINIPRPKEDPLSGLEETIILCNPAIKEFKVLPKSFFFKNSINRGFGFGYDSISNDYKVVRIFSKGELRDDVSKAEVYTLGSDSWREIKMNINLRCVYYWWNDVQPHGVANDDMIISFDMHEEKFNRIPLPDNVQKKMQYIGSKTLTIWNESLALFFTYEYLHMYLFFEMWVMVDNFDGSSWIKHLTIEPLAHINHLPLAFWKKDELFMESSTGEIVTYNLFTKKLRKLPINHKRVAFTHADFYVKSLVSVKGGSKLK